MLLSVRVTLVEFKAFKSSEATSLPFLELSVGGKEHTSEDVLEKVNCLPVEDWRDSQQLPHTRTGLK